MMRRTLWARGEENWMRKRFVYSIPCRGRFFSVIGSEESGCGEDVVATMKRPEHMLVTNSSLDICLSVLN